MGKHGKFYKNYNSNILICFLFQDIILNLLLGLLTIICSIITNSSCDVQSAIHKVPGVGNNFFYKQEV